MNFRTIRSLSVSRFIERQPFIATALLCSFSLMFSQIHWVSQNTKSGIAGEYNSVWQVSAFAMFAVLVYGCSAFIKTKEPNVYKRILYISAVCSAAYLAFAALFSMSNTMRKATFFALCICFLAGFALLLLLKKRVADILLFVSCLCVNAAFGIGWPFVLFAVAAYIIYVFTSNSRSIKEGIIASCAALLTALAACICAMLVQDPKERILVIGFILCIGLFCMAAIRKSTNLPPIIVLMFGLGLIMRFVYTLDITIPENQHDVFQYFSEHPRHHSYIKYIYQNWSLPTEQVYAAGLSQYYHPPLYHFFAALWMKAQTLCGFTVYLAFENIQYLTMMFSTAMMVAGYKLLLEFKLKGVALYTAFALLAFHPTFYIFAGSINNDCLTTLFLFLAMLYTVRWFKEKSIKNTVVLALCIGLAMMTKLSGAMIAFGTGFVFLYAIFDSNTGNWLCNIMALRKRFALFAAICCPLGLWWTVRCYIKFKMPVGYVPKLSSTSEMYLGKYTLFERLTGKGSYYLTNIFPNIGATAANGEVNGEKFYDYGIAPYIMKSSLFGEYFNRKVVTSDIQNILAYVLVFASVALVLITLFALVFELVTMLTRKTKHSIISKDNTVSFSFLIVYYAFLVVSYILLCLKFEHTCTMDFRYIVPTLLIGAVWTGLLVNGKTRWQKALKIVLVVITVLFSLSSIAFYGISYF